ncbi:conjugal transfer protein TraG N-terminal domain-containing protein [Brenneria sp. g21c3]|uniref:conjugal transfer protein TraG N-terminal domain-containing protein n=1 Tax=Brenneria sp. g21c3 TaxID=3093893 RepID=UPI002ECE4676|nr:conjugal transfer protein TraG N-terminal domain-containing protein [Brenneria sp. g21c3]
MTANTYLEYFLTLLGWLANNGIWSVITATGLFAFPLLAKLIEIWLKARSQGADEGNQGGLALAWMEHTVYTALVVIMFACVPLLDVDLSTIRYDASRISQCGRTVVQPSDSGYASLTNELGGKTAAVPVWWYFIHAVSKGVTNAAVSTLPCSPDLRQIRFEVQHTRISDPTLAQELQDFVEECYAPSRARLKRQEAGLALDISDDVAWLGSSHFLTTPGYYDTDHARSPRSQWPYDGTRDAGLFDAGTGGYPTCKQWWQDGSIGLKDRLLALVRPTVWQQIKALGQPKSVYEASVLRSLVSQRNMQASQSGSVYGGYGGNAGMISTTQALTRLSSLTGTAVSSLAMFPAFDSLRQALPMVQAILQMALVICLPIVILFSAYALKTVITLTAVQFALFFVSFWWELARWLDSWLLIALYDSSTHSSVSLTTLNYGFQNSSDDIIVNIVMGTMFLVLPAFWMGALGWAGIKVGGTLENAASTSTKDTKTAGGSGSNTLLSVTQKRK